MIFSRLLIPAIVGLASLLPAAERPNIVPLEGESLKPLLTGEGEFPDRPLFWEHEGNAAIRVGDRKLVRQGMGGEWELFDLAADRTEQHDLAAQHPEEVATLTKHWREWARRAQVLPKPGRKKKGKGKRKASEPKP